MLDLRLRPAKDRALEPVTRILAPRVGANALTAVSLALALAAAASAWAAWPLVAVGCWGASRLVDGLDGPVARARGEASDLGGYLDMTADTIGYALIPVGVALGVDDRAGWVATTVLLAVLFVNAISWSYLAAVLEKRALGASHRGEMTSVTMPGGLIEGTETIALYTLLLAVPAWATAVAAIMAALVAVNVAQRVRWATRVLGGVPTELRSGATAR